MVLVKILVHALEYLCSPLLDSKKSLLAVVADRNDTPVTCSLLKVLTGFLGCIVSVDSSV